MDPLDFRRAMLFHRYSERNILVPLMPMFGTRLLAFLLLISLPLTAQTGAGRIQGTVKDSTDAVLPNARVLAEHVETGTSFTTQTNRDGLFLFPSVQTGKYRLTAES